MGPAQYCVAKYQFTTTWTLPRRPCQYTIMFLLNDSAQLRMQIITKYY